MAQWTKRLNGLQWGHDLLIVEGVPPPPEVEWVIALQWGHDLLIVEGVSRGLLQGEQYGRFNGATIC